MYINYGNYDEDNVGVDYDGAIFGTNIHWWDINVPRIPKDKLASIQLSTQGGTKAVVGTIIPDSYFDREGLDPDSVKGYVDENELPLGQGVDETYSFKKVIPQYSFDADFDLDGTADPASGYLIHNDQWSAHDVGIGIPEPTTALMLTLAGCLGFVVRHLHRR